VISPMIQAMNQNRVPSSRPRTSVLPKGKDARSNPERKVERKRWVRTLCSITMLCNPTGLWWQVHFTMSKHVHRAVNLANEDVDFVGTLDQTWSILHGSLTCTTFEFACKSIHSFGETLEWESVFLRCCLLSFVPCLWSKFWWRFVVCQWLALSSLIDSSALGLVCFACPWERALCLQLLELTRCCGLDLDCLRIAILSLAHRAQFLVAKAVSWNQLNPCLVSCNKKWWMMPTTCAKQTLATNCG